MLDLKYENSVPSVIKKMKSKLFDIDQDYLTLTKRYSNLQNTLGID